MDTSEIENILENCEFFKGLGRDEIKKMAGHCKLETYSTGESIFRQGDFGENLYVIAEGHVFLERSVDLAAKMGSVVTAILGSGRVLGCWSTLLGEPHNLMSSATCQKPAKVVSMKGIELREMMLANRELGFNVLEKLCFLLRDRMQGAYGVLERI
jgi:CRP/FNR family cyclic AMP-dependent transcriptional regulator